MPYLPSKYPLWFEPQGLIPGNGRIQPPEPYEPASVPESFRMELAASFLLSQSRICNLIAGPNDSRWIDQSPGASNGGRGIQRTFRIPCIGRFAAAVSGRISWSAKVNPANTGSVTSADGVPNTAWTDGNTANWCMMSSWQDRTWSGNVAGDGWGRAVLWGINLADLANYAEGNPFAGKSCTARIIYHALAAGLTGLNFQGGRGVVDTSGTSPLINDAQAINMTTGAGTIQTAERACGVHPDGDGLHPPAAELSAGGSENGKSMRVAGVLFYDPNATHGYVLSSLGTSQYTTVDDLNVLGGGTATCTSANARATISALTVGMSGTASLVVLHEHANVTVAEAADFAAGGYSVYQANLEAVLDAWDAHSTALFGRIVDCHWLRAPFQRSDQDASIGELKAAAHQAICQKRPNCCHDAFSAYQRQSNAATPAYGNEINTTDGIHPTGADGTGGGGSAKGNGDVVWMSAAWNAVAGTSAAISSAVSGGTFEPASRVFRSRTSVG